MLYYSSYYLFNGNGDWFFQKKDIHTILALDRLDQVPSVRIVLRMLVKNRGRYLFD